MRCKAGIALPLLMLVLSPSAFAKEEQFVIATSPSVRAPVEALSRLFEASHPHVKVKLYVDAGLELRRSIAAVENSPTGRYFIGSGPIHLVAPGGDELLSRLEQKQYILPGSSRPYAEVPLVLVVPESLVDAPESFEALAQDRTLRVVIGDPQRTALGLETKALLTAMGLWDRFEGRVDQATDVRGVVDHLLNGQADVGILFGPDAARERQRMRVVAISSPAVHRPIVHSIAMERSCPDRALCEEFLDLVRSPEARAAIKGLGYVPPAVGGR